MRELRDPIHGFIALSDKESAIVDTPLFQRLRRIKQLALASLVYPGALHTRFEHSLGVAHLAQKLADRLLKDEDSDARSTVRLAALLHDIGHGPFSHVSESVLEKLCRGEEKIAGAVEEKIHEKLTHALIMTSPELAKLVCERDREAVVGLLSGRRGSRLARGIVSGPLDADKLDYLLRDSYFCGVKYGVYDIDRLVATLVRFRSGDDYSLGVGGDGLHSLEQFVLAKYYMTTQVYRHRLRLITDAMITRGILLGIREDKLDFLVGLYSYDESPRYLRNWVRWDDQHLTVSLLTVRKKHCYARDMFQRLHSRQLFKRVFHRKLLEFGPLVRDALAGDFRPYCSAIEQAAAKELDVDPNLVIAHRYRIQSVREQSRNSEDAVSIVRADGTPVAFDEESTLFHSIDAAQKDEYLDIYAPVQFGDAYERDQKLRELDQELGCFVEKLAEKEVTARLKGGQQA